MVVEQAAEAVIKYSDRAKVQEIGKDPAGNPRYMIYITGICKEAEFKKGDILMVSVHKIGYKPPKCNNPFLKNTGNMNNNIKNDITRAEDKLTKEEEQKKSSQQEAEEESQEYGVEE